MAATITEKVTVLVMLDIVVQVVVVKVIFMVPQVDQGNQTVLMVIDHMLIAKIDPKRKGSVMIVLRKLKMNQDLFLQHPNQVIKSLILVNHHGDNVLHEMIQGLRGFHQEKTDLNAILN
jgi:hypothetical protein